MTELQILKVEQKKIKDLWNLITKTVDIYNDMTYDAKEKERYLDFKINEYKKEHNLDILEEINSLSRQIIDKYTGANIMINDIVRFKDEALTSINYIIEYKAKVDKKSLWYAYDLKDLIFKYLNK